jgi:hypothetical protein
MRILVSFLLRSNQHHRMSATQSLSPAVSHTDKHELWEYMLSQVELSISAANFNTWFRDSAIVDIEDGVVVIGVPSQFFRD